MIRKLLVTGNEKKDSEIIFESGLNIIWGPSNTGKSYIINCIDYALGAKELPFPSTTGYDTIQIELLVNNKSVCLIRKLGENHIQICSEDPKVKSGKYRLSGEFNGALLRFIGIDDIPQIITTSTLKHATLSWRNILRLSVINENRIIEEEPAYFPKEIASVSAVIMTLIYLDTGDNFSPNITDVDLKTLKIKNDAIRDFIQSEILGIKQLIQDNDKDSATDIDVEIENEIKGIADKLMLVDAQIHDSVRINKKLSIQLMELNEEMTKLQLMRERYGELRSQYMADLTRLNFIADTAVHHIEEGTRMCPFCQSRVEIKVDLGYAQSAQAEYRKIKEQLKDLESVIQTLEQDKSDLEEKIEFITAEFSDTKGIVEKELVPYSCKLKNRLNDYEEMLNRRARLKFLKDEERRFDEKSKEYTSGNKAGESFKIKDHISETFIDWIEKYWEETLQNCSFENYKDSCFDKKSMDIVVNGEKKRYYGKGYRAFLNSIVTMGIVLYLKKNGKYSLPLLMIDSPILSLKEGVDEKDRPSSPMRSGLFMEFLKRQSDLQIIIVENDIPQINYGNANLISFTGSNQNGRYGFLMDLRN